MPKANKNTKFIPLDTWNNLVDNLGNGIKSDTSIDQVGKKLMANSKRDNPHPWKVVPYGGNKIAIRIGNYNIGDNHAVTFPAQSDSTYSDIVDAYECCTAYPLQYDNYKSHKWYIIEIPNAKYSADDNSATINSQLPSCNTVKKGDKRPVYVFVGATNYKTSCFSCFNASGAPNTGFIGITNNIPLAGLTEFDTGNNVDVQFINKYHHAIAEVWIDADGSVASVNQLIDNDIKVDAVEFDQDKHTKYMSTYDTANKVPIYGGLYSSYFRRTVGKQNCQYQDCGVVELYDTYKNPQSSKSMPYFCSQDGYGTVGAGGPTGCIVAGDLKWASLDAHYQECCYTSSASAYWRKTLEIAPAGDGDHVTGGTEDVVGLYGVDNTECRMWHLGSYKHYETCYKGELDWLRLDTDYTTAHCQGPTGPVGRSCVANSCLVPKALEISTILTATGSPYVTLYDFPNACEAYTCCAADKVLVRQSNGVTNPTLRYVTISDFLAGSVGDCCALNAGCGILISPSGSYNTLSTETISVDWSVAPTCLCGGSHHALRAFDPINECTGTGWTEYDDHGGPNRRDGVVDGGPSCYYYMLLGSRGTKAQMYGRNLDGTANYLGGDLYVQNHTYIESTEDVTPETATSGALQVDGGATIKKKLQSNDWYHLCEANSFWKENDFQACSQSGLGTFVTNNHASVCFKPNTTWAAVPTVADTGTMFLGEPAKKWACVSGYANEIYTVCSNACVQTLSGGDTTIRSLGNTTVCGANTYLDGSTSVDAYAPTVILTGTTDICICAPALKTTGTTGSGTGINGLSTSTRYVNGIAVESCSVAASSIDTAVMDVTVGMMSLL